MSSGDPSSGLHNYASRTLHTEPSLSPFHRALKHPKCSLLSLNWCSNLSTNSRTQYTVCCWELRSPCGQVKIQSVSLKHTFYSYCNLSKDWIRGLFVLPFLQRNYQTIMLSVYIGTHRDTPRVPATLQFLTHENWWCKCQRLWNRARIVEATSSSVALETVVSVLALFVTCLPFERDSMSVTRKPVWHW